ncbi:MAG: endonuclease V [Candidatus Woesearchaeota archaeon]
MVDIEKLKKEQLKFAKKVIVKDDFDTIKTIAGCDQGFKGNKIVSEVVVLDAKTFEILEKKFAVKEIAMPYIPSFQFFREGPAIIEAFNKLDLKPDVLLIDSNGILHPRRIGMASHIGIILDIPTIGVCKSLLCGAVNGNDIYVEKELRGKKIMTKEYANPLYVSPGHKISIKTAVDIIKTTVKHPHKFPEPIHIAHRMLTKLLERIDNKIDNKKGEKSSVDEISEQ